ncbi:MAG: hypothetical protein U0R24_00510 [Solirubrobacterales bacterium]
MGWKDQLDSLEEMLAQAAPVPLTSSVRVDADAARQAVADLEAALPADLEQRAGARGGDPARAARAMHALRAAVAEAPPIPLTDQVRIDTKVAYGLIDEVRAAVPARSVVDMLGAAGEAGARAVVAIDEARASVAELRTLIFGPGDGRPPRKADFDGLLAQSQVATVRSSLLDASSALQAAGVDQGEPAAALRLVEKIERTIVGGMKGASARARVNGRDMAKLTDGLGGEIDGMVDGEI